MMGNSLFAVRTYRFVTHEAIFIFRFDFSIPVRPILGDW